jgi:Flp pilus assembly protein TadD
LHATLTGTDLRAQVPANVAAYEQYLLGQFFYNRRLPGDIERATESFRKAVELDPAYARAWAALAGAYSLAIGELHQNRNPGMRKLQGEAARRAVELDPRLAVAQARLAQYLYHMGEREAGDVHMRRAEALDPDDPLVLGFMAGGAMWRGDTKAAVDLWQRSVVQDPLSPMARGNYAYALYADGQFEEAIAQYRKTIELNPGAGPELEADIARVHILLGRYDVARETIDRLPAARSKDFVLAFLCRSPDAEAQADAARALARLEAPSRLPDEIGWRVRVAEAYVWCGRGDEALDSLVAFQRQLKADAGRPIRDQWYLQNEMRHSPLLRQLHADARWTELTTLPDRSGPDSGDQ